MTNQSTLHLSPRRLAIKRYFQHTPAKISLFVLLLIMILCIAAPWFTPYHYAAINWDAVNIGPEWTWRTGDWLPHAPRHIYFGTDINGRDLCSRILYGGRLSIAVGLCATFVSLVIGVLWGAIAGYAGGRVDGIMMRIVDTLYALPFLFFIILLTVLFGSHIFLLFVAIGTIEWLDMARIVRAQTLSLKKRTFVEAARISGASHWLIIRRHIIPNTLGPVVICATLTVPRVIVTESFLSFLGLGIQEPKTSWGMLIRDGTEQMQFAPWSLFFPALFLCTTLLCFHFIGDGLRDACDTKNS
jgi:oligopeptide transport system permease protein